jgi:hypothetical protein
MTWEMYYKTFSIVTKNYFFPGKSKTIQAWKNANCCEIDTDIQRDIFLLDRFKILK